MRLSIILLMLVPLLAGCSGPSDRPDLVWGRKGVRDGDIVRPRAAVIDRQDRLWVVDFTARIQAYDLEGQHLGLTFTTPDYRKGRPSGLGLDKDGRLIVADSHYHCFRIYSEDGRELRVIGGKQGAAPGQLGYVSDVVQDHDGYFYVAEFGEVQRITKLDPQGQYVTSWGSEGAGAGQFARIRALALGSDGLLYAADACNHRIQVFHKDGRLAHTFGTQGTAPGQFHYPYDLAFGPDHLLYVVEYGNHRVQRLTPHGESRGVWGGPGREPGRLHNPWALAIDRKGRVHVLDTENHRVQRISF